MINWELLGIEPTDNIAEIKKAYAKKSKEYHPEEHPEEFRELHASYKEAVALARKGKKPQNNFQQSAPVNPPKDIAEKTANELKKNTDDIRKEIENYNDSQGEIKPQYDFETDIQQEINREITRQNSEAYQDIADLINYLDNVLNTRGGSIKRAAAINEFIESNGFRKYKDNPLFLEELCKYLKSKNYSIKTLCYIDLCYDLFAETGDSSRGIYQELYDIIREQAEIEGAKKAKRKDKILKIVGIAGGALIIIVRFVVREVLNM